MERRMIIVFTILILLFATATCNLSLVCANTSYADASKAQSSFTLQLDSGRGNFLDCHFSPLTGNATAPIALLTPTVQSYYDMFTEVPQQERAALYLNIQKSKPFLLPVETVRTVPQTALLYEVTQRYLPAPIAPHLIGYCNAQGVGVSGLESAAQETLVGGSTARIITGGITAHGLFLPNDLPHVEVQPGTGNAVMLTIDAVLQRVCEGIAAAQMTQGSIVVMETDTGKIRASVSMPTFDPNNVQDAIATSQSALVNRSINSYNVGSVFKPLLAAVSIKTGITLDDYHCNGSVTIGGHTYRCAHGVGHGDVTVDTALQESCNCYFVTLGQMLGGDVILDYAQKLGLGQSTQIFGTMQTASGNLPSAQTLQDKGELANFSFGQGELLATPVQIAAMFNTFANDGMYVSPTFVQGIADEYTKTITENLYFPLQRKVFGTDTARSVCEMLVNVVEQGIGSSAKPEFGTVGGKTGTAQTGRYAQDGTEWMDLWFAGFYPAENPSYTIVVLLDDNEGNSDTASEIFAQVATALRYFYTPK